MKSGLCWIFMPITALMMVTGLAAGCSRKSSGATVVELRTEVKSMGNDSMTRLLERLLLSQSRETDRERLIVLSKAEVTLNEAGDSIGQKSVTVIDHDRDRIRENSVYIATIDSLNRVIAEKDSVIAEKPVKVEVPKEVERNLTWWEKLRLKTWWALAGGLILLGVWHRWGHLLWRRKT